jgi:hypothetical protein
MKRVLTASILGLAASVATSFGQATYYFDTYAAATTGFADSGKVEFANNAVVGAGFTADLLWHDQGNSLSGDLALAIPVSADGYIRGGTVTFDPTWTGTPLDLTISVSGPGGFSGSLAWTEPAQTPGAGYELFTAMPTTPLIVTAVPEPTTLALAGLGLAGMMIFRKRA